MRPWAVVDDTEINQDISLDHDFGPACRLTWTLIQDHLTLAEKSQGRATLAHNARISNRYPDWSLGLAKIPTLMLPASHRGEYFDLIKDQAAEKLRFMERILTDEASLCTHVAAVHSETLTKCIDNEEDKALFPKLRNKATKLARSRSAAYGKRVYESIGKQPATFTEMEDTLIKLLPHQEYQTVAPSRRCRSWSPLPNRAPRPRSRSPARPRPQVPRSQQNPRAAGFQNRGRQSSAILCPRQQNNGYAPARRPYYGPPTGRQNKRRTPANTASSNSQLSAEELAGLRALLNNHGGRQ